MRYIKQSTSVDLPIGPFLDSADGFTAMTGLTLTQPDIRLKKNGGAWAQKNAAQTLSHEENGWYEVTLDATDTATLGQLMLNVSESGALPVWHEFTVLAANVYDSLIGGGDILDVSVTQFGGTNGTFASGRPEVNTTHAAGTAWGSGAITAGSIAADAIGASELAADAVTEIVTGVWAAAARTLTAGTNIVLAKGTGVTGFNDLDAAGVRGAVGLASANLDTQITSLATAANLSTVAGYLDTEISSILTVTNKLDTAMELDGAVYRFTANALEQAPSGGGGGGDATEAKQDIIIAALAVVDDNVDAILADTAEIGVAGAGLTALASATNLATVDTVVDAIKVVTDKVDTALEADGPVYRYTANALEEAPSGGSSITAADVWQYAVESGFTAEALMRLVASAVAGKVSGAGTGTETFRDLNDTKNRIVSTVDADGNRSAVTVDGA